jgi:hypothetical protein
VFDSLVFDQITRHLLAQVNSKIRDRVPAKYLKQQGKVMETANDENADYKTMYEELVGALLLRQERKRAADEDASKNFREFISATAAGTLPDWLKPPKS